MSAAEEIKDGLMIFSVDGGGNQNDDNDEDSALVDVNIQETPMHHNASEQFSAEEASTGSDDDDDDYDDSSGNRYENEKSNKKKQDDEYKEVEKYASKETKRVRIWRILVILSMLVVGAIVSTFTYKILAQDAAEHSQTSFELYATTIEDNVQFNVREIFEAKRALSNFITVSSMANSNNGAFSYYWVRNYETHAHETRQRSMLRNIAYAPIVRNVKEYMQFAEQSKNWYEESKFLIDKLEPGSSRSKEPVRRILDPFMWILFNESATTYNDSILQAWANGTDGGIFNPRLHTSPPPSKDDRYKQNEDFFSNSYYRKLAEASTTLKDVAFSEFASSFFFMDQANPKRSNGTLSTNETDNLPPYSLAAKPVYNQPAENEQQEVVGYLYSVVAWEMYLTSLIPPDVKGIQAILRNSCGQAKSYDLSSGMTRFIGNVNANTSTNHDNMKTITLTNNYSHEDANITMDGHCMMYVDVYPTDTFDESYESNLPIILTVVVALLFVAMACIFFMYDYLVKSRDDKVVGAAARSTAIVASLFPSNVRERLLADQEDTKSPSGKGGGSNDSGNGGITSLKGFLAGESQDTEMLDEDVYKTKPIADLFPETTVMFGDIVGFTAWSSVREPAQIFTLLETLYYAFDEIANRRRVFKVETVGDCYVAVCGLPEPQKLHAVTMARFARDCLYKMWTLTTNLEVSLGPETADLCMRVGLHSGPVTAGVLRGERSRFQLFGDTMNTAARMESNGKKDRIHLSSETAELLIAAGKNSWVSAREDKIIAKGKGELQTFWLTVTDRSDSAGSKKGDLTTGTFEFDNSMREGAIDHDKGHEGLDVKTLRLIDWHAEVLHRLLKQIVAKRLHSGHKAMSTSDLIYHPKSDENVLDEVKEIITLPQSKTAEDEYDVHSVQMDPKIIKQLTNFVTVIASMYRDNSFHNFEHASHVTMSVVKLLSRIVAPSAHDVEELDEDSFSLHDHTYGITSDPLTQFACVFSALIHDLDHHGVPNTQLVVEKSELATIYNNQSVAEQNSVDLAWQILMDGNFKELRCTVYSNETEMKRFRQLVVNSVMATDIADKELKVLRNSRWEKAFSDSHNEENIIDTINRKATIVIEHLIQASDVAHTMQHWHIYQKWNTRFFMECYRAFEDGRAEVDPSINWYKGEIGFFDFYIIPLAKKLKDCGVFGVSSDEYLNYAMKNRQEWEQRGQEVVNELIEKVQKSKAD